MTHPRFIRFSILLPTLLILFFQAQGISQSRYSSCFGDDVGAASTNESDHFRWAQSQSSGQLQANLADKLNHLFGCALSKQRIDSAYGEISAAIAQTAPSSDCYGGDSGAADQNADAHKKWAAGKSAAQLLNAVIEKVNQAFACLDSSKHARLFSSLSVVIASNGTTSSSIPPGSVKVGDDGKKRGFQVWMKTEPCSVTRTDWLSVSENIPTDGIASYEAPLASQCKDDPREGCTFSEAMAEAERLRTVSCSAESGRCAPFENYCCKNWSVWSNQQTGKMRVVTETMGTAGFGFILVESNLCCEQAAARAGFDQEFCTRETDGGKPVIKTHKPKKPPVVITENEKGGTIDESDDEDGPEEIVDDGDGSGENGSDEDRDRETGTRPPGKGKTWVLESVTVDPPQHDLWKNSNGSASFKIDLGDHSEYSWTLPPQYITTSGLTITLNVSASAVEKSRIYAAIAIDEGDFLVEGNFEVNQARAWGEDGKTATATKSVFLRPPEGVDHIKFTVMFGYTFRYNYNYKLVNQ